MKATGWRGRGGGVPFFSSDFGARRSLPGGTFFFFLCFLLLFLLLFFFFFSFSLSFVGVGREGEGEEEANLGVPFLSSKFWDEKKATWGYPSPLTLGRKEANLGVPFLSSKFLGREEANLVVPFFSSDFGPTFQHPSSHRTSARRTAT